MVDLIKPCTPSLAIISAALSFAYKFTQNNDLDAPLGGLSGLLAFTVTTFESGITVLTNS